MAYFITNTPQKSLESRLNQLIQKSTELKILVGFFYFSGIQALYESLKDNPKLTMKILVGLDVEDTIRDISVNGANVTYSNAFEAKNEYISSLRSSISSETFDTKEFYDQISLFTKLLEEGRIIIKKTYQPNHSKLYLFYLEEGTQPRDKVFITGSSNLTMSGLRTQKEFNVEISDYGFEEAEEYFEDLWDESIVLSEDENVKKRIIEVLKEESPARVITPYEAYVLILKTYIESLTGDDNTGTEDYLRKLLENKNFKPYSYQIDAVKQALRILDDYNGVIIADVVGLGKSVIASLIANRLKSRGIVIAPPGLIGNKSDMSGWRGYCEEFDIKDWEVFSSGGLEEAHKFVKNSDDIDVVIVDEAHRFRNEDTEAYEILNNICRGKIVILLTATPFNNNPSDILSLLKLFSASKNSGLTLDGDLKSKFTFYGSLFDKLAYIKKNHNSSEQKKRLKALSFYEALFEENNIDLAKVKTRTEWLASQIRSTIEPVTIRRNRKDLEARETYRNEIKNLSKIKDPEEWMFELTKEQSAFYDEIINYYFAKPEKGGLFKGAIYRPFEYEEGIQDQSEDEDLDKEKNRERLQQRNLFDFMRRLIVKRFESSFGAFEQSIHNFLTVHKKVREFVRKTDKYILERDLLEKIYTEDVDVIEEELASFAEKLETTEHPQKEKIYQVSDFVSKKEFLDHIDSDIELFELILEKLKELDLIHNDPKSDKLLQKVGEILSETPVKGEPKRKVLIFTEYKDTAKHLNEKLLKVYGDRLLSVINTLTKSKIKDIEKNFDASAQDQQDDYDVLLATDKISEGFNLNRAGIVINYDIPWNPVRVIQRVGRINRISKKVFEELKIANFFPTEQGSDIYKSREIAQHKMFMIHNTLGEDSKIFDVDEEPTEAKLFEKLTANPEDLEEESFSTIIYKEYKQIESENPSLIENLSKARPFVKSAKSYEENNLLVCFKKGHLYIKEGKIIEGKFKPEDVSLEEIIHKIRCEEEEPLLNLSPKFWDDYVAIKNSRDSDTSVSGNSNDIETQAFNKINTLLRLEDPRDMMKHFGFLQVLREDIAGFGTLSKYTLRKIANIDNESENGLKEGIETLEELKQELGVNYLKQYKKSVNNLKKEIIIALENQSNG